MVGGGHPGAQGARSLHIRPIQADQPFLVPAGQALTPSAPLTRPYGAVPVPRLNHVGQTRTSQLPSLHLILQSVQGIQAFGRIYQY